jgi:hypothetical protein
MTNHPPLPAKQSMPAHAESVGWAKVPGANAPGDVPTIRLNAG